MRGRIKKWGNSAAVRIPPSVMHAASLESGEVVDVREEAGRIVIEPVRRKKYDLDNLVKRITSKNQHAAVDFGPAGGQGGVIMAEQVKSLDWRVRKAKRKGVVSPDELTEVRAKILALIG